MTTLQVNSAIEREAVLLQQINTPLPAQTLADYQELSQKLRDERITPDEHAHLLALVDVVELADAERMQHLFELAQLRNLPLDTLMQQLGIKTLIAYGIQPLLNPCIYKAYTNSAFIPSDDDDFMAERPDLFDLGRVVF